MLYFSNLILIARSFMSFVLWLHIEFLKLQSYFPATSVCCLIWSKKCSKPWFPGLWQADHFRVCHGQSPYSSPTPMLIQQDRNEAANSSEYTSSYPTPTELHVEGAADDDVFSSFCYHPGIPIFLLPPLALFYSA